MEVLKNLIVLVCILYSGLMYYKYSTSKNETFKKYAFIMKMFALILSFILAFIDQDFITIGNFVLGGRSSVMILIIIEIVDAFVDNKKDRADV